MTVQTLVTQSIYTEGVIHSLAFNSYELLGCPLFMLEKTTLCDNQTTSLYIKIVYGDCVIKEFL